MRPAVKVGILYAINLFTMVGRQRGYIVASIVTIRFIISELARLPLIAYWFILQRTHSFQVGLPPEPDYEAIRNSLEEVGIQIKTYNIDMEAFRAHIASFSYPRNYAAGPVEKGGGREDKILEYFISLDLLSVKSTDTVIDVGSQWSIFPEMVRKLSGATVYQQDLIYPQGLKGSYIGGRAEYMPVRDGFADKLVLHNAFEHFEGESDSHFIAEAWRVLKPGGMLCILPLALSGHHTNITDPLVNRRGLIIDEGARVVELPWWHNPFGRYYDAATLQKRILTPGSSFSTVLYHILNVKEVHPRAYLHFVLVMKKPVNPLDFIDSVKR